MRPLLRCLCIVGVCGLALWLPPAAAAQEWRPKRASPRDLVRALQVAGPVGLPAPWRSRLQIFAWLILKGDVNIWFLAHYTKSSQSR